MSKDLATINIESPIEVKLADTKMDSEVDESDKIELFKKLEFKQLLADIGDVEATEEQKDKEFDIEPNFEHVDFSNLEEATIHFELENSNYLRDNILKFGFHTGDLHVVIDANEISQYKNLVQMVGKS